MDMLHFGFDFSDLYCELTAGEKYRKQEGNKGIVWYYLPPSEVNPVQKIQDALRCFCQLPLESRRNLSIVVRLYRCTYRYPGAWYCISYMKVLSE